MRDRGLSGFKRPRKLSSLSGLFSTSTVARAGSKEGRESLEGVAASVPEGGSDELLVVEASIPINN